MINFVYIVEMMFLIKSYVLSVAEPFYVLIIFAYIAVQTLRKYVDVFNVAILF